jgi:hypothetical protein
MRRIIAVLASVALLSGLSACGKPDGAEIEAEGYAGTAEHKPAKPVEIDPITGQIVVKENSADPAAPTDNAIIGSVTPAPPEAPNRAYTSAAPKIDTNVADLSTPTTDQPK